MIMYGSASADLGDIGWKWNRNESIMHVNDIIDERMTKTLQNQNLLLKMKAD
jgi:hypothetical protein